MPRLVRQVRSYLPPELPFLGIREREGRNRTRGRDGGERVGASQPGSRQPASQDDDEPARIAIGSQASPDGVVQDSDWEPAGGRSPVGSTSTSSSYSHPDRYRYSTWEGPLSRRSNDRPRNATDRNSFGRSGNNVISFTFWVKPSMPVSPLSLPTCYGNPSSCSRHSQFPLLARAAGRTEGDAILGYVFADQSTKPASARRLGGDEDDHGKRKRLGATKGSTAAASRRRAPRSALQFVVDHGLDKRWQWRALESTEDGSHDRQQGGRRSHRSDPAD